MHSHLRRQSSQVQACTGETPPEQWHRAPVIDLLCIELHTVLGKLEPLLDHRGQLPNPSPLLTYTTKIPKTNQTMKEESFFSKKLLINQNEEKQRPGSDSQPRFKIL